MKKTFCLFLKQRLLCYYYCIIIINDLLGKSLLFFFHFWFRSISILETNVCVCMSGIWWHGWMDHQVVCVYVCVCASNTNDDDDDIHCSRKIITKMDRQFNSFFPHEKSNFKQQKNHYFTNRIDEIVSCLCVCVCIHFSHSFFLFLNFKII